MFSMAGLLSSVSVNCDQAFSVMLYAFEKIIAELYTKEQYCFRGLSGIISPAGEIYVMLSVRQAVRPAVCGGSREAVYLPFH
jgi:hypothetical protein